ncbi:MAG: type II toxin-antitoxin system HicA family toxin [Elusimicrobia bacterium]|nr:type II toxin-antitoxin system HicA family toxin [Elusimicrobiota bacterium]
MARLPVCRFREVISALRKAGFVLDHHTGGHAILYKPGHPNPVTVPSHPGDLKAGTVRRIIKDAGLTVEQFANLL